MMGLFGGGNEAAMALANKAIDTSHEAAAIIRTHLAECVINNREAAEARSAMKAQIEDVKTTTMAAVETVRRDVGGIKATIWQATCALVLLLVSVLGAFFWKFIVHG